jgi:D-psicose/D-tagatose/L-ribulose 3-epimerase
MPGMPGMTGMIGVTMKFGINTYLWGATFGPADFHRLPAIKDGGFDGIEVAVLDPVRFPASAIRQALARVELACTAVAIIPQGLSLGASETDRRTRAQAHVRVCIQQAAEAGATLLSGPMYTPVGDLPGRRRTDDEWRRAVESWQTLAETAAANGVDIAIEPLNRFETYFLNTAADAAAFCDAVGHPSVGLLLDTFHANIEEKHLGEALRTAAPHLKHLHTCENDRGVPGSGHVAWEEFFTTVAALGYDRWLTIESFGFALGELSAAAAIWRDLAPTPEAIAFDGLAFLKRGVTPRR